MSIYVERFGCGEPLVLIHGWGLNGSVWRPVIDRLQNDFELYVVDLPGHGQSIFDADDFSLEYLLQSVLDVVPSQAHWLGWSLGGLVAQLAAIEHAQRVNKLVLVATNAQYVCSEEWNCAMKPEILAQFAQGLEKDYRATLKRFLAIQALGAEGARQLVKDMTAQMAEQGYPDVQALKGGLALLKNSCFVDRLAQIKAETLLQFGRLDTLAPGSAGEAMKSAIPDARLKIYEHAAHAPFVSHADAFCNDLRQFLQDGLND